MIISTGDPKKADTSVWYKFWDATVAINAMCIRNGYKSGIWSDLGELLIFLSATRCSDLTDTMKVFVGN